jgi:hypothetical protein
MSLTGTGLSSPSSPPPPPENSSGGRVRFLIFAIAFGIALLYVAGVFYNRLQQDRAIAAQRAERQREQDEQAVEFMGGDRFEILNFYASPGVIHRGDSADLCYGVSNAKSVALAPPDGSVWPAFSHCLQVSPRKTTTYTLTATSNSGETKTATVQIEVR